MKDLALSSAIIRKKKITAIVTAILTIAVTICFSSVPVMAYDPNTEVVFIENNLEDYHMLEDNVLPGMEVYVLDSGKDGLVQITDILTGRSGIDAIHIVSHGAEGMLDLGTNKLSSRSLSENHELLTRLGALLDENGALLLYGCNAAKAEVGGRFINELSAVTGADVSASTDPTGASELGGDWVLEAGTGAAVTCFTDRVIEAYEHSLTIDVEHFTGEGIGTSTFSNNGYSFSLTNYLQIVSNAGYGWTGTANDDFYVDNFNRPPMGDGVVGSIISNTGYFGSMTMYVLPAVDMTGSISSDDGTVIINGKSNGNVQFTYTLGQPGPGIDAVIDTTGTNNYYTSVDLSSLNEYMIDELSFKLSGNLKYLAIDAFQYESSPPTPNISSATYNAATGTLTVTGDGFSRSPGSDNDVDASKLTITGQDGATYTLNDTPDVEIASATSFTLTLGTTDRAAINTLLNKNGTASTSGTTYNLAATNYWNPGSLQSADISDPTNGITVSNVPIPAITSATYDVSTGELNVVGTGFLSLPGASNDIIANKMTLAGEGGSTYTLTNTTNVEITSATQFTLTLNPVDKAEVRMLFNKNGSTSTGGTSYNLAAAEDWNSGADAAINIADLVGNGITVINVSIPSITSATYDVSIGELKVAGTGFLKLSGSTNDIVANRLTITGESGVTYTLTSTPNAEITSATSFTLVLGTTDRAAVSTILNKNGNTSTGGTPYNLSAAEDWNAGADAAIVIADLTGNPVTVSNVPIPSITSAAYDAETGSLSVTGSGFLKWSGAANDINAAKFTITGEGGEAYTLTDTPNVEITSNTQFDLVLSSADKAAVNMLLNRDGSTSTGGTTYSLSAAEDWNTGADTAVAIADLTGNTVTVSNVAIPSITSAAYDAETGILAVTGSGFLKLSGYENDIIANKLTITGEGGITRALADTPSVDISSDTLFSLTLGSTDKAAVNALLNKNGTASGGGTTYNLAAAEDWNAGADAAVSIADIAGNGITVSNVPPAGIVSISVTDGTYIIGQNIDLNVQYNSAISVADGAGSSNPYVEMLLSTGGTKRAYYFSNSGPNTLVFRYTVQQGNEDTDGITLVSPINLNGGTIKNTWGDDAALTFTLPSTSGLKIDGIAPVVTAGNISISGHSGIGGEYIVGDTITASWNNTSTGDNNSDISGVTVNFSQFGGSSAVAASNTSGTWTASYTIPAGSLDETNRNVSITATDFAGNTITVSGIANAAVDNILPDTTITAYPSSPTNSNSASFSFTSSELGSTYEGALDGGPFTAVSSPISFTGLSEGSHTFQVWAVDDAGNRDSTPAAYTWTVDISGPAISISAPSAAYTKSGSVTYTVTYTGADSISLSDGDITIHGTGTAAGTATISGSGNERTVTISSITGNGTLGISIGSATASDASGNTAGSAGPSAVFIVDNTSPTGTIKINNDDLYMTSPDVILSITGDDGDGSGVSQMRFSLDGANWSAWESFHSTRNGTVASVYGTVTVYMQLKDSLGNISSYITDTIIYKALPTGTGKTVTGTEDTTLPLSSADFVYSSSDGSLLTKVLIESLPAHGVLKLGSDNITVSQEIASADLDSISFIPESNWYGSTSFTWLGHDGTLWTGTAAQITINIGAANDAPVAADKNLTLDVDTPQSGTLEASDPDGDSLIYELVSQGSKGTTIITDADQGNFTYTPFSGITGNDTVTYRVYDQSEYSNTASINVSIVPAGIADLEALSISAGALTPGFNRSITVYSAIVPYSVGSMTVTASVYESHATLKINGISIASGGTSDEIALTAGIVNPIAVEVTAQDSTVKTYNVNVTRESAGTSDDNDDEDKDTVKTVNSGSSADIRINGKAQSIGTVSTTTSESGHTLTSITMDSSRLEHLLAQEGNNARVTVRSSTPGDLTVVLNGQMLRSMGASNAMLEVITDNATYTLPAAQINMTAIAAQLGGQVKLEDIKINLSIAKVSESAVKLMESSARAGEYTIVAPPVEFSITCTAGGRTVSVNSFNAYVERTIAIPEGVDPSKITTGIIVDPDNGERHVPTRIIQINGRYYARINSLTNSIYAVIYHPYEFRDSIKHWAREEMNDMGSRIVVSGSGNDMYEPDRNITRAEFAAIVVKALGLKPGEGTNHFRDINSTDWYADYVETAYSYGIVSGYSADTFKPEQIITREQAMAMIARAMKLTGLTPGLQLSGFSDVGEISPWARESAAACIDTGIISGRGNDKLAPKENITRAEVAVIVRRLLQISGLI